MKIIYENDDLLVIDKPAGIDVISLGEELAKQYPGLEKVERNGIIHRLDKDTSGVILTAKSNDGLIFFQKQFKNKEVEKKYIALAIGNVKNDNGVIETLIGRNPREWKKQKVFLEGEPDSQGQRNAITSYKIIERFKDYTLIEVTPKTGRKHQIRCHFSYIGNPIAGDKLYGFKNQPCPNGLNRQFLHASYIKIKMLNGEKKEFRSGLPEELKKIIDDNLKIKNQNVK